MFDNKVTFRGMIPSLFARMARSGTSQEDDEAAHARALLIEKSREFDGESSDSDSTIIGQSKPRNDYMDDGHRHYSLRIVVSVLVALGVVLVVIGILLVRLLTLRKASQANPKGYNVPENEKSHLQPIAGIRSCGVSATEAIAAGCHFDTFSFGWTPPECMDLELYNENLDTLRNQTAGAHTFFTQNRDPIPFTALEDYSKGTTPPGAYVSDKHEVLTTWEHYLVACTYGWQKVQRAAMRNWPLDEWSASYALAERCGPDLLNREERESQSLSAQLKPWYPICGLEADFMMKEIAAVV